jgi:hypothetical protein
MSTALISVEGVLGEHDVFQGFHPLLEGMHLAKALKSQYQVHFATIQADVDSVETWLMMNGMTKPQFYEELIGRDRQWTDLDESALRAEQARNLRSRGYTIGFFVSADPEAVLQATASGIPAMLFVHPSYHWAEYRPDRRRLPKQWQQIEDEVSRQRVLKATDPRLVSVEEE